jgi:hypothetical protein
MAGCKAQDEITPMQTTVLESPASVPDLLLGDRVEVLWRIERDPDDAGPHSEERWWGASVHSRDGQTDKYILLYDEYLEFAPAQVSVCLLGAQSLRDEDAGGDVMLWRREGDTSVTGDSAFPEVRDHAGESADNDDCMRERDVYSMRDVVRAQEEVDAEQGECAGDAMLAALGSLPAVHQTEMAIKYRQFADELKSELAELMRLRGPGCVVTEGDIQTLFAKIRSCGTDATKS